MENNTQQDSRTVQEILSGGRKRRLGKSKLILGIGLLAVLVAAAVVWGRLEDKEYTYATVNPEHGPLVVEVRASGTLEPRNTIKVGAELSGTIRTVHKDFNDSVTKGDVLAHFDVTELQAQADRLEAQLAVAKANSINAAVQLTEDRREYSRKKKLHSRGVVSQKDLDLAQYALSRAEAGAASRQAEVDAAMAELREVRHKLDKADIVSPINGLVLERKVEAGQAVASGFQTPELFTLVSDLATMKLLLNIDEADTGQLEAGQEAVFRVDAYPGKQFPAALTKLRYAPEREGGVVVYKAEFAVDNSALLLRPGMTVTADITVARVDRALIIPNAALRFRPPGSSEQKNPDHREVWVLKDGTIEAVPVQVGKTNGRHTEILSGLDTNDAVVTSAERVK